MRRYPTPAFVALFVAVSLAACGSESPTGASQSLDLNAVLSQMSAGNPSSYSGATSLFATPFIGSAATLVPSSCTYSAPLQAFTCPARTMDGFTITGSYYLLDANGAALSVPDPAKVAAVRTITDVNGTVTLAGTTPTAVAGTTTLTQHSDMTMSGLLTGARTLNGTTTSHDDGTITSPDALHDVIDMTTMTKDLVLPAPNTTNPYPKSGSITMDMTWTSAVAGGTPMSFSAKAVLTFDGTSVVTTTLTGNGFTETCTLDLAARGPEAMKCG